MQGHGNTCPFFGHVRGSFHRRLRIFLLPYTHTLTFINAPYGGAPSLCRCCKEEATRSAVCVTYLRFLHGDVAKRVVLPESVVTHRGVALYFLRLSPIILYKTSPVRLSVCIVKDLPECVCVCVCSVSSSAASTVVTASCPLNRGVACVCVCGMDSSAHRNAPLFAPLRPPHSPLSSLCLFFSCFTPLPAHYATPN